MRILLIINNFIEFNLIEYSWLPNIYPLPTTLFLLSSSSYSILSISSIMESKTHAK